MLQVASSQVLNTPIGYSLILKLFQISSYAQDMLGRLSHVAAKRVEQHEETALVEPLHHCVLRCVEVIEWLPDWTFPMYLGVGDSGDSGETRRQKRHLDVSIDIIYYNMRVWVRSLHIGSSSLRCLDLYRSVRTLLGAHVLLLEGINVNPQVLAKSFGWLAGHVLKWAPWSCTKPFFNYFKLF